MVTGEYELIAKALRVVAVEEEEVWGTDDPGACWWRVLNELTWMFSESDPAGFSVQNFRSAARTGRRYDYADN